MRIPGVKTARLITRQLKARLLGGGLILGYHRIVQKPDEPDWYEIGVSSAHFEQHLEVLKRHTHPISLVEMVQRLKEGSLRPRSVAVTFDDGYVDNLYTARPILERYQIPATFFICTAYLGQVFWWDELAEAVGCSQTDPVSLLLESSRGSFSWDAHPYGAGASKAEREALINAFYRFLMGLEVNERDNILRKIRQCEGFPPDNLQALRGMDRDELLQLASNGLVEIGAHTHTHPVLPQLSIGQQNEEILASKLVLEEILGRVPQGFAYPNGKFTADTRALVRNAGHTFACSSNVDLVRPGHDVFALPRFWPRNVNGDQFLNHLKAWMKLGEKNA